MLHYLCPMRLPYTSCRNCWKSRGPQFSEECRTQPRADRCPPNTPWFLPNLQLSTRDPLTVVADVVVLKVVLRQFLVFLHAEADCFEPVLWVLKLVVLGHSCYRAAYAQMKLVIYLFFKHYLSFSPPYLSIIFSLNYVHMLLFFSMQVYPLPVAVVRAITVYIFEAGVLFIIVFVFSHIAEVILVVWNGFFCLYQGALGLLLPHVGFVWFHSNWPLRQQLVKIVQGPSLNVPKLAFLNSTFYFIN